MKLDQVREVWTQEADCCQTGDMLQELTLETHDGGGGWFVTITTERWALNLEDIDVFIAKLRAILAREKA